MQSQGIRGHILGLIRRLGLMRAVNGLANAWFGLRKKMRARDGGSGIDAIYGKRYFQAETDMTHPTAGRVVECLIEEFAPKTVADVGCGTAVYLRDFEQKGVTVKGYEGSEAAIRDAEIDPDKIQKVDLSQPLTGVDSPHDLVVSFEVAEHLPDSSADVFVKNVTTLGDTIVFSAAHPGQGGTYHINEQPREYWIEKFERIGFRYQKERAERVRARLKERECVWWLCINTLVFERNGD